MRICDLIKDQETYQAEMGQTVLETVRAMVERNIGAVPVVHNGRLVGIFSERDLMKRVVAEGYDPRSTCLAEVMTDDPLTINMNEEIDNCMALMRRTASGICPFATKDNWSASSRCATFCCTI